MISAKLQKRKTRRQRSEDIAEEAKEFDKLMEQSTPIIYIKKMHHVNVNVFKSSDE